MNELTLITTYYNNKDNLIAFVDDYLIHKQTVKNLKLIIVDDGSQIIPAESFLSQHNIPDSSLYKVTKDLGFNSHGCRNLAMMKSTTDWNILLDSDIIISSIDIPKLATMNLYPNHVYGISVNGFLIEKSTFFSCKGYDEEFINFHYGDRHLINYLKRKYQYQELNGNILTLRRSRQQRRVKYTDKLSITTYDDKKGILYQPNLEMKDTIREVELRYMCNDFSDKKILTFPWEQVW